MKKIGLIGGMSWESSLEYYRIINEKVKRMLGGLHSAQCILYSVDFEKIEMLQKERDWETLTSIMIEAAQSLEKAGADFVIICTNTMHKMADDIQESIVIPLLHIADATADIITAKSLKKVGLLGTKFTMEGDFYTERLKNKYALDVIVPNEKDRQRVHNIIYKELCLGNFTQSAKNHYIEIIHTLVSCGAEAIVLGCTEIPLLIKQDDVEILLLDTMNIHAESAVKYALERTGF